MKQVNDAQAETLKGEEPIFHNKLKFSLSC